MDAFMKEQNDTCLEPVSCAPQNASNLTATNFAILMATYLVAVQVFRMRRARALSKQYPDISSITPQQAHDINNQLNTLEFPFVYHKSLQFALFRTYGFPSVSALLLKTTQLSDPKTSPKRYTDTVVLIVEFVAAQWGSERWAESIARMNTLHAPYVRSGKITNEDLLYTLYLFAWEPVRWIDRWEWRTLTDVEKAASGVFWKGIGEAMGIEYSGVLAGAGNLKTNEKEEWNSGLDWMHAIRAWGSAYEEEKMVPSEANFLVAEQTTAILLWGVPSWGQTFARRAIIVLMDERLRKAMLYSLPPNYVRTIVHGILEARRFVLRHFSLPRPRFMPVLFVSDKISPQGTYYMNTYDALPYYVKPTLWNRFGPGSWTFRVLGKPVPGDEGEKFAPCGYRIPAVGPRKEGAPGWGDELKKVREFGKRTSS
ncbi:hypothetical protein MMC25_005179 [Agyrium rufum]|nr:hypothetical protein [Agyrium rufum]